MSGLLRLLSWLGMGLTGAILILLAWNRAFSLAPESFSIRRSEAVELARGAFEELGPLPADARFHVQLTVDKSLERRLLRDLSRRQLETLRSEPLGNQIVVWRVRVESEGRLSHEAHVGLDGFLYVAQARFEEAGSRLSDAQAARRAMGLLARRGLDLGAYDTPFFQGLGRDSSRKEVRFRRLETVARLDGLSHGVAVTFQGSRLSGWRYWSNDVNAAADRLQVDGQTYVYLARCVGVGLVFLVLIALWFRYYDAGQMRLRRSLHVAELVVASGIPWMVLIVREIGATSSSQRALWVVGCVALLIFMGFLAFLTSGIGEALARDQWHHRLAAFEAILQGNWRNLTVARAVLHGLCVGCLGAGLSLSLSLPLKWFGATPLVGPLIDQAMIGGEPVIGWIFREIFLLWMPMLLTFLVVVPFIFQRLGPRVGFLPALVVTAVMVPMPFEIAPIWVAVPWLLVLASIPLVLFLGSDLLASILAVLVMRLLVRIHPLVMSADPWLEAGAWITLVAVLGPALISLRWLHSNRSFTYGYDASSEIPVDVLQRVAERERQRLELATAKEVQTAILPRVPPELVGLQVAHAYLPASEIGGDFYDAYPLDADRLAFALGDVAGHGIPSGLVMSTVRGALRAHFRFEPDVAKVFESVNGMLCELADRRLLTTLVYGLFDSRTGSVTFASSGHVVWRLSRGGKVDSWLPHVYPLGARPDLQVEIIEARLLPGDTLVLMSDGFIEAAAELGGEPFGYGRLESCLQSVTDLAAPDVLAGVLSEVSSFLAGREPDDDCTALILQASGEGPTGAAKY